MRPPLVRRCVTVVDSHTPASRSVSHAPPVAAPRPVGDARTRRSDRRRHSGTGRARVHACSHRGSAAITRCEWRLGRRDGTVDAGRVGGGGPGGDVACSLADPAAVCCCCAGHVVASPVVHADACMHAGQRVRGPSPVPPPTPSPSQPTSTGQPRGGTRRGAELGPACTLDAMRMQRDQSGECGE